MLSSPHHAISDDHLCVPQETCTSHACAVPQPSSVAYSWTNPSNAGAGPIAVTPWFCPDYISLDYPARVATGTGATRTACPCVATWMAFLISCPRRVRHVCCGDAWAVQQPGADMPPWQVTGSRTQFAQATFAQSLRFSLVAHSAGLKQGFATEATVLTTSVTNMQMQCAITPRDRPVARHGR